MEPAPLVRDAAVAVNAVLSTEVRMSLLAVYDLAFNGRKPCCGPTAEESICDSAVGKQVFLWTSTASRSTLMHSMHYDADSTWSVFTLRQFRVRFLLAVKCGKKDNWR